MGGAGQAANQQERQAAAQSSRQLAGMRKFRCTVQAGVWHGSAGGRAAVVQQLVLSVQVSKVVSTQEWASLGRTKVCLASSSGRRVQAARRCRWRAAAARGAGGRLRVLHFAMRRLGRKCLLAKVS